ncbi:tetratricopeptide repeat protein [bacterium]|nr:tetratricopeptide repeat protein [bacterium]
MAKNSILKSGLLRLGLLAGLTGGLLAGPVMAAKLSETWQSAVHAYAKGNYARSVRLLQEYLQVEQEPEKITMARFFLAEAYRLKGLGAKAIPIYKSLSASTPSGPLKSSARFRVAEMAYNRGEYQSAVRILRSLARDSRADFLFPQTRLALVKTELKLRHAAKARKVFSELLAAFPRSLLDPEIKFLFGIMKEFQGQDIDALKIYEELKDNPLAWLFSGAILESQGRYLPAIAAYNNVLRKTKVESHRQMALYFKVRTFYKTGDFTSAQTLCRKLLFRYPKSPYDGQAALLRLLILLSQARFAEVINVYPELAYRLTSLSGEDRSLVQFTLAEAALNLNRFREAITYYQEALALAPGNRAEIWMKLSYIYSAIGEWDQAGKSLSAYFKAAKNPDPRAHLFSVIINLQNGRGQTAFRSAKILVSSGNALAELARYFLAEYYLDHDQAPTLVVQWALLEKAMGQKVSEGEYREITSWSRLLAAEAYYQVGNYQLARDLYQEALAVYPQGRIPVYVCVGLTWCSFKLQDFHTVLVQGKRLQGLKQVSDQVEMEIELLKAHANFNLQQYPEAIRTYRNWMMNSRARDSAIAAVLFQIGWAHYMNKSYLDALETWQELARKYPDSPESTPALFRVADTYFQAGENSQARAVYQQLNAKHPDSPQRRAYRLRIAQTYYNDQKDDEAIRGFTAILEEYPDSEEAEEARNGIQAASYRIVDQLNNIPAFREYIDKFPGSNLAEDIHYRIGEAYYEKGKYDESLKDFVQFILTYTKSPRTPNAQYYVAVCHEQLGHSLQAVLQAGAFVNNYPQHELVPEMLFRQASNEFQLERYSEAAEHFAACAENYSLKEYQPRAWYNAGVAYEKLQMPEEALDNYGKLAAAYSHDVNTGVSLSRMALLYAGLLNYEGVAEALELLEKTQNLELLQKTQLGLAALYQEQGEMSRQTAVLKSIMKKGQPRSEEYSLALVELASIYEKEKNWTEAIKVYALLAKKAIQAKWREAAKKRVKLLRRILKSE